MSRSPKRISPRFFSEKPIKRRILIITFSYFLFMVIILGRVFSLHLTNNTMLSKLAEAQYQKKITLSSKRGNIYDSHGEELAIDVKVDSLYANPRSIDNPKQLSRQLSGILKIESDKIETLLSKDKKFVWIKRWLSEEESKKIQALHEESLGVVKEYRRSYPNKELASTLLGAVGLDSIALAGLELYYDSLLKSPAEPLIIHQDAKGKGYSPYSTGENENTNQLVLTVDKTIQFIAERELSKTVSQSNAKSGVAIVLNSHTGEVLAMASYPNFDPNVFAKYDHQFWKNRAVLDSFEPGSIFKAITASAALESGKVNIHQSFNCEGGSYEVGSFTIHDHGHYGSLTLPEIIRVSSNIGSFKISQMLGREQFGEMIKNFGFGAKSGIDFPGEVSGILSSPSRWSNVQQGTIAFGQGISVTPLQIANAYSAIANGGYLMRPYLVSKVVDSKGRVIKENSPQIVRKVMNEVNTKLVTDMLKLVVGPGGTGQAAQIEEFGVAGKTGTAQKVVEGKNGYAEGKFIASFVGYAPVDDPKITVLVSIDEPKGNHFGGVVAAPAFREIARQTLSYLHIPHRNSKPTTVVEKIEKESGKEKKKYSKEIEQDGPLIQNHLNQEEPKVSLEFLEEKPGMFRIPKLTGKPLREVLRAWKQDEVKLVIEGSGLCIEQHPAPGELVRRGGEVRLSFKPPS